MMTLPGNWEEMSPAEQLAYIQKHNKASAGKKKNTNSKGKQEMEKILTYFEPKIEFVKEFKFADDRKYRFDFYISAFKIGIEYEGIYSEKSRHTHFKSYSEDCRKYNLAALLGYTVLRYTADNYNEFGSQLRQLLDGKK